MAIMSLSVPAKPEATEVARPLKSLNKAIKAGRDCLLGHRHADGYWWYTLEANDSINAEYVMLLKYLGIKDPLTEQSICRWIISNQNQDGSWSLYYEGPGDLSATVECYLALKMAGHNSDSAPMRAARRFILANGGITKIRIFTRIHLALFGLADWDICPQMPVALIQLPKISPINIYEFSSWARASIVPLLVIMDQRKTRQIGGLHLNELYVEEHPKKADWRFENEAGVLSLEYAFIKLDKALKVAERLRLKPLRKQSLKKCERYICDHLSETEDIYPAMFYGILALNSLGYSLENEYIQKALLGLKSFQIIMDRDGELPAIPFCDGAGAGSHVPKIRPRQISRSQSAEALVGMVTKESKAKNPKDPPLADVGIPTSQTVSRDRRDDNDTHAAYQQCCISPVWDTAWAGVTLLESGLPSDHKKLIETAKWLLSKQIVDVVGDWAIKNPNTAPGGWSFEFKNKHYPDVDDTIEVLTFLYRVDLPYRVLKEPFERGLKWLLSMVCRTGGFAAFDKDNDLELLNRLPFSDHGACLDPPTVDITGRVIGFLVDVLNYRREDPLLNRAANFIAERQEADGSFWGRWGVNYIYGTWCALEGLGALRRKKDELVISRAVSWLKGIQNSDGGFGESCESYKERTYIPLKTSLPSQTAWALMGLIHAGQAGSIEAANAAEFLINTQTKTGTWEERHYTGTGFPGHFYIRYHGYRNYFPLLALSKYKKALSL